MTVHILRPVVAFDDIRIDMACVVGVERTHATVVVHMRSRICVRFTSPPLDAAKLEEIYKQMRAAMCVCDAKA
jgi:hypothetical protein